MFWALLSSPEQDNPYLEVVQRLHFHDWSQSVEGQRDINTLVWHQRCVNGQGGAWDDSKAGQEKNRGDGRSPALSKISPKYNVPFVKHHLPHLPSTPELPLLLLQGGNTAQMSRQSRTRQGKLPHLLTNSPSCPGASSWELSHCPHGTGLCAEHQPAQQGMTWTQSQVLFLSS